MRGSRIAIQVRSRKEELRRAVGVQRQPGPAVDVKRLTTCPSCLQGLARFSDDTGAEADYIVVEMARALLGADWLSRFVEQANRGGIERALL